MTATYPQSRRRISRRGGSALLLLALLLPACAGKGAPSGEPLLSTRAGSLAWDLWLAPNPPRQTETAIWIAVRSEDGSPQEGATVEAAYLMPAMGAMAEMRGRGDVTETAPATYRVDLDFPMQGTWSIDLSVETTAGSGAAEYSLTTGTRGLREVGARGSAAPSTPGEQAGHAHPPAEGAVSHYTCSMHPSVESAEPGSCPICGMTLTPVTAAEVRTGELVIDDVRRQAIGVRTAPVGVRAVEVTIRAVGTVTYDETRLHDVTLKNRGWIEDLRVEETGQQVRRGQTLFTLYSPELLAAQEELFAALASQRAARETGAPDRADYLVAAARRKLGLWDLPEAQIDAILEAGEPVRAVTVPSPASGVVVQKNVVEGAAIQPGQTLYRIAGLDRVWVEAEVYESELPLVRAGQRATVSFAYLPGRSFQGTVGYVYPYLDAESRTGRVRVELANPDLELKPDMYADVVLRATLGEQVVVPEEAVLFAGTRRLVFVDLGEDRLAPREVELGVRSPEGFQVLGGLSAGEIVVTSGNFLVAAESRLKSAGEAW